MTQTKLINSWQENTVDKSKSYFELRYGSIHDGGWDDWLPVASLSKSEDDVVFVEILVDKNHPEMIGIVDRIIRDIEFYLIEKNEPDPWEYAIYHSGTMSNAYSDVHWSYFDPELKDHMI